MSRKETTRITVEIPKIDHKKLKMFAATEGKTMKTIFIEILERGLENRGESLKLHESNDISKKTIEESFKKTKTRRAKTAKQFSDKLEIPEEEAWLYKPENKEILKKLKKSLKQKGSIYRGSFSKYLKK